VSQGPLDVVVVDPGADHPVPFRHHLDKGDFVDGFFRTLLGPGILDEALTLLTAQFGHLHEHALAVGVRQVRQGFAFQFRLHGMHDHARFQVVDPEIVVVAETLVAQLAARLFPGLFPIHPAAAGLLGIIFQGARGGFDDVLDFSTTVLDQVAARLDIDPGRHQTEDENDAAAEQENLGGNFKVFQCRLP